MAPSESADEVCHSVMGVTSSGAFHGQNPLEFSFPLLSLQLVLVITITRILYFLLKPLKQPKIVSEIVGGIILGPSVLGRSKTFRKAVFPPRGMPVLDTLATFGLLFVTFLIGLKMDPSLLRRSGRKAIVVGLSGFLVPFSVTIGLCFLLNSFLSQNMRSGIFFLILSTSLSVTSFAALVPIISEVKLLNTELGRLAVSSSLTNDGIGWVIIIIFITTRASQVSRLSSVWAFLSLLALVLIIYFIIRPLALWVIANTPEGKPVADCYIFTFLMTLLVVSFIGDIVGANTFQGALVLGLAIPDGPPLGAALEEKIEYIVSVLLLPLYYTTVGLQTNTSAIKDMSSWGTLQLIIISGWLGKVIGVLLPSLYFRIPFRDALSLGLFMNSKGIIDLLTYHYWKYARLVDEQAFSILTISSVAATAIVTPIVATLFQPSRQYMVYKRRTVQHLKPGSDFCILTCIHNQANVPSTINLLEVTNATNNSPVVVHTLHLVELIGRAVPLLITHQVSNTNPTAHPHTESEHIIKAFQIFAEHHKDSVSVFSYTTISPYASMHDDICHLALDKRAALIIMPFHKRRAVDGVIEVSNAIRRLNRNVIANSPCSVGFLIDRTADGGMRTVSGCFSHDIMVFFFGGEDDREALAYGARMASHPNTSVTVIRFLPSRSIRDNPAERRLDNRLLDEFRNKYATNERILYQETLVKDMEEIVGIIRTIENGSYSLLMVGMRHETNSVLSEGLTEWSQCPELGVVGDYLASPDFEGNISVLVIRQQDKLRLRCSNANDSCTISVDNNVQIEAAVRSAQRALTEGASLSMDANAQGNMPNERPLSTSTSR